VGRHDVRFEEVTVRTGDVPPVPNPVESDMTATNLEYVSAYIERGWFGLKYLEQYEGTYWLSAGNGKSKAISLP
jgi:hypothetical protein